MKYKIYIRMKMTQRKNRTWPCLYSLGAEKREIFQTTSSQKLSKLISDKKSIVMIELASLREVEGQGNVTVRY